MDREIENRAEYYPAFGRLFRNNGSLVFLMGSSIRPWLLDVNKCEGDDLGEGWQLDSADLKEISMAFDELSRILKNIKKKENK